MMRLKRLLAPMDRVLYRKEYGFEDQSVVVLKGRNKIPSTYPILKR